MVAQIRDLYHGPWIIRQTAHAERQIDMWKPRRVDGRVGVGDPFCMDAPESKPSQDLFLDKHSGSD
jgi:hypothetical protein